MSRFSVARLRRVMLNDILRVSRPILYGPSALLGVMVTIYLLSSGNAGPKDEAVNLVLFGGWLIIAGLLFTGVAFQDMHHPLQRSQYLMLPISSFERLLSRYLLTGPLFVLYATAVYVVFDLLCRELTHIWTNGPQLRFSPFAHETLAVIRGYLLAHIAVFVGAICFRSHALLKTLSFLVLLLFALALVEELALRILFPDSYSWTRLDSIAPLPVDVMPWFAVRWMNVVAVCAIAAWLLYIAWLCLRDHEAADGV